MKYLKIILAVMLLSCLLGGLPYGFFEFIRFVAMFTFGVIAFQYHQRNERELTVVFGALAVLFQPFIKIALGRTIWNVVDVFVAILLIGLWIKERREK